MFILPILALAFGVAHGGFSFGSGSDSQSQSQEDFGSFGNSQENSQESSPSGPPQGTTSQILGCSVTQYQQVVYQQDLLLGQNQYVSASSVQDCVSQCLQQSKPCAGINFLSDQNLCAFSSSALTAQTSSSAYQYPVPNAIHASISCVAAVASAPVGCGKQAPQYQPQLQKFQRIIGGTTAKAFSWPWLVNLNCDLGNGYDALCGSTLIRVKPNVEQSDIIVTAAHCVTDESTQGTTPKAYNANQFTAIAAKWNVSGYDVGQQKRTGAAVVFHPQFKFTPSTGAINDIAMIKLDSPIAFNDQIRPVCLPPAGAPIPVGQTCYIAGWGRINSQTQDTATVLQQISAPAQSPDTCAQGWGDTYQEDMMICAGSLKGDVGTCQGDSGGTLACQQSDGSWMQFGATSFGVSGTCLSPGMPSIFTRISNYIDWINQNAQALTSL